MINLKKKLTQDLSDAEKEFLISFKSGKPQ